MGRLKTKNTLVHLQVRRILQPSAPRHILRLEVSSELPEAPGLTTPLFLVLFPLQVRLEADVVDKEQQRVRLPEL